MEPLLYPQRFRRVHGEKALLQKRFKNAGARKPWPAPAGVAGCVSCPRFFPGNRSGLCQSPAPGPVAGCRRSSSQPALRHPAPAFQPGLGVSLTKGRAEGRQHRRKKLKKASSQK